MDHYSEWRENAFRNYVRPGGADRLRIFWDNRDGITKRTGKQKSADADRFYTFLSTAWMLFPDDFTGRPMTYSEFVCNLSTEAELSLDEVGRPEAFL
jgi:hypothetical protein